MTKSKLRSLVESIVASEMPGAPDRSVKEYLGEYPEGSRWHRTADYHVAAALERIAKAKIRMSTKETDIHCRCLIEELHSYWHSQNPWSSETAYAEWLDTLHRLPSVVAEIIDG